MTGLDLGLTVPAALVDAIALRVVEMLEERAALAAREPEPWISPTAAAEYLGKSRKRLYELARTGALPCGRDGDSVLFRVSDLDAYLLGTSPPTAARRSHGGSASPTGDSDPTSPTTLPTRREATGGRS